MSSVSVVMPVRDRPSLTAGSLDRFLAEYGDEDGVEVVVVDDGSEGEARRLLERYADRVTVVGHARPRGFAAASNEGAAAADGEYVIFLNNDTMSTPGWLHALVEFAERVPHAVAVGAKLLYTNDTVQHAGIVICHDGLPRHVYRGFSGDHPLVSVPRRFHAVTAACMLVRRDSFEAVGGFDTAFVNGFEDVDLCLRFAEHGEVHYCPDSVLYHLEAATRGDLPESPGEFAANAALYRERWGHVTPDDLSVYVADGLLDVTYGDLYPMPFRVSPEVGELSAEPTPTEAYRLLNVRARQVFELLRENAMLRVRLGELERRALREAVAPERPVDVPVSPA
ncbi:MAG: glycosyltransferase family 2 protein [Gaiellaceae bacterium]